MTTITIKIKRSKNVWAWGNRNVGKEVTATFDTVQNYYLVNFADNKHLEGITENLCSGFVELENAEVIS